MKQSYHVPVLLSDAISGLNIQKGGLYIDVTFGGGGHSRAILEADSNIRLIAFDKDIKAEKNAEDLVSQMHNAEERFRFFRADFRYMKNFVNYAGYESADGILADLGVSSHQFDEADRGFSYRKNARPDMRMNQAAEKDAVTVLNEYSKEELIRIFRLYGEIKKAGFFADLIVNARSQSSIETVEQLNKAVEKALPRYNEYKLLAQLYQALRIEVNDELKGLERFLEQAAKLIRKDGRLVVLTYHSLEDRMVKNFINSGNIEGELDKDIYGNINKPFEFLKPKYRIPSDEEIHINSRAASAKLRIAKRI